PGGEDEEVRERVRSSSVGRARLRARLVRRLARSERLPFEGRKDTVSRFLVREAEKQTLDGLVSAIEMGAALERGAAKIIDALSFYERLEAGAWEADEAVRAV